MDIHTYTHITRTLSHTHTHTHERIRTMLHACTHVQNTPTCTHTQTHSIGTLTLCDIIMLRIQIFHKILLQYTYVALFRDKIDGSLRGIMLIGIDREVVEGKKCTIVKVWLDHVIIRLCGLFATGGPSVVQECLSWRSINPLTDVIPSHER